MEVVALVAVADAIDELQASLTHSKASSHAVSHNTWFFTINTTGGASVQRKGGWGGFKKIFRVWGQF